MKYGIGNHDAIAPKLLLTSMRTSVSDYSC
jgi:hypothetical protein